MRPSFFRLEKIIMNQRIIHFLPLLLAASCFVGGLIAMKPLSAAESGVRGTVLWGPVKPGPTRVGQSDEAPLSATFLVFTAGQQVARFKSDKQGNFELLLPAGDYTIVPDKSTPVPAPHNQIKTVTVPADGFAEVTLSFDTGMR